MNWLKKMERSGARKTGATRFAAISSPFSSSFSDTFPSLRATKRNYVHQLSSPVHIIASCSRHIVEVIMQNIIEDYMKCKG